MKNPTLTHRILALLLLPLLFFSLSPPLLAAVTGRSADSSLAGTEKILSDSSGTDTYILVSTLWASQVLSGGLTASGSTAFDFSGSTGAFKTSTGINTFGGSAHNFSAVLQPTTNDAAALGTSSLGFSDLFLANGGVINWNAGEVTLTQAAGVITVAGSGAGDLRITTAGTNAASAVTVGGTQSLSAKTLVSPVISTGLTASGSAANTFAGSTGTFITSTGANTFKGSAHNFDALLRPTTDDGAALGDTTHHFSDLFLATGAVLNFNNGNVAVTHSSGILTMGTGELRITTPGTNAASVPTLGSTSTMSNKTFVAPVLGAATATSINKVALTAPATGSTLTIADGKTLTASNTLTLAGTDSTTFTFPPTTATVMTTSLASNDIDAANAITGASNALVFEGATADGFEASLSPVDPTADQTVSIPNFAVNFALVGSTLTTNTIGAANSFWHSSNTLNFEGATADTSELTLTVADPTADVALILPDAAAATYSLMYSTLATNAPDIANSVTGTSGGLFFEGSTADTSEIKLIAADATADVIYNLPNAAAATYSLMSSTLSTNAADVANSVYGVSNGLMFEGATADAHEIRFTPADATADVVYLLPDAAAASYAIMSSTLATNAPDIANSVTGVSAGLNFEGTADAYETTLTATDPTADRTVTIPNATGTVSLAQASTTTALTADNQAVTPGTNSRLQLTSDNATDTNRTFTLSATGAITGQIYVIVGPATNACEIADTGIQVLSATWSPGAGDTLTLMFDGTNFNELCRSNN